MPSDHPKINNNDNSRPQIPNCVYSWEGGGELYGNIGFFIPFFLTINFSMGGAADL